MIKNPSFVAIGHITKDLVPHEHLGGGVSYSAVAASKLGLDAHIITKCPPNHPYINDLQRMGVTVHVLPSKLDTLTSFRNLYDESGKRKQEITERQEIISVNDYPSFPKDLLHNAIVLVAPVAQEVDLKLFPLLATSKLLALSPQGYFRSVDGAGLVTQQEWTGFESYLQDVHITVLSDADIAIGSEKSNSTLLETITRACPLVVLTQGEQGSTIYEKGIPTIRTQAFALTKDELHDFTGAGDVFATAFITEIAKGQTLKAAVAFTSLFAALKIMGIAGGIGIDSIPSLKQVQKFQQHTR